MLQLAGIVTLVQVHGEPFVQLFQLFQLEFSGLTFQVVFKGCTSKMIGDDLAFLVLNNKVELPSHGYRTDHPAKSTIASGD